MNAFQWNCLTLRSDDDGLNNGGGAVARFVTQWFGPVLAAC